MSVLIPLPAHANSRSTKLHLWVCVAKVEKLLFTGRGLEVGRDTACRPFLTAAFPQSWIKFHRDSSKGLTVMFVQLCLDILHL